MKNNITTLPSSRGTAIAGGRLAAIIPTSIDEAYRLAKAIHLSDLAPKDMDTPEAIMVAILHGLEVGLPPMQAVQRIAVINGRPSIWGDAIPALLLSCGFRIEEQITGTGDERVALCSVTRPDGQTFTGSFSVKQAEAAVLWGKAGPWTQYPDRMLQMRARGFAARDGAADVLGGLYLREEAEDIIRPAAAQRQARTTALDAADTAPDVFDCDITADAMDDDCGIDPEPPAEPCVDLDDMPSAETPPVTETPITEAEALPVTKHYWPPHIPADGAAAAMVAAAGPSSGSPQSTLSAALARLGGNIMAANGSITADGGQHAPDPENLAGADLAANVLQMVLRATDPDHIEPNMRIYRGRPGWKTLTVAQVETIDAAIALRQTSGRRRRAS